VIISNSTFIGNSANQGGAIYLDVTGSASLFSVTISGSTATSGAGIYAGASPLVMRNTIVANSSGPDCTSTGSRTITYSLIEDKSCGVVTGQSGNLTGDPSLSGAGLQDNGGTTPTIAPLPASKVINAGDNAGLSEQVIQVDLNGDGDKLDTLTTDQRGLARVVNAVVDMGAVEVHAVVVPSNGAPPINYTVSSIVPLSWSLVTWATGYEVQVSTSSSFTPLQCGGALQAGNNLTVNTCSLPPGTYYWRVRATGAVTWSATDTFTIGKP
jgi:hypothetical protein